jgi:hypothetical protein
LKTDCGWRLNVCFAWKSQSEFLRAQIFLEVNQVNIQHEIPFSLQFNSRLFAQCHLTFVKLKYFWSCAKIDAYIENILILERKLESPRVASHLLVLDLTDTSGCVTNHCCILLNNQFICTVYHMLRILFITYLKSDQISTEIQNVWRLNSKKPFIFVVTNKSWQL